MARQRVKSVGVWSVFKFTLVYYLLFYLSACLIIGLVYIVIMAFASLGVAAKDQANVFGAMAGGGILGAVIAFVCGLFASLLYAAVAAVGAAIYNLISLMTGGIELNLIDKG